MSLSVDREKNTPSRKLFLDTKTLGLLKEKDRNHPILGSSGYDKARMISIAFAFYFDKDDDDTSRENDIDSSSEDDSDSDTDENWGKEYYFMVRNHGFNIPPYIELLTGISNEDSKNIEITTILKEALQKLMEIVDENTEIVAQDANFHKIVISNELFHSGMFKELELWKSLPTYCTLENSITNKVYRDSIRNIDCINLENDHNLHTSIQTIRCCLTLFTKQRNSALSKRDVTTRKLETGGRSSSGLKFDFGKYYGKYVSDVVVDDPKYCLHVLQDWFMKKPEICEEINNLIAKPRVGERIRIINLTDTIKTLFLAYSRNEIFNTFKIEISFQESHKVEMSKDLKSLIEKIRKLSPVLCGTFIDYLCHYLVELNNFSDVRLDHAVTYRYFFEGKLYPEDHDDLPPAERLFLDRDDLVHFKHFLKEDTKENVQSLEADIVTMKRETKEAFLKWFKILPSAYNKRVKDCSDIFICSLAHHFCFFQCDDFEHLDDILQTIYNVDLTAFSKFILKYFPTQNTLCDPDLGNEDISADADFIANGNEISEMKVSFLQDECFFPQLIGYTALAKHIRKLNITKISVLNIYHKTYNVYDISQWKDEDRERFYLFLTNETLMPLSDY